MTIDNDNLESRHIVQVNLPIPVSLRTVELNFINRLRRQIDDIDEPVRYSPFGSQIVFQLSQEVKQDCLSDEVRHSLSWELSQDVALFHLQPPGAFPLRLDCGNADGENENNQMTVPKSENREAWASAAKPENFKMAGLCSFGSPAFNIFSRAVPIVCHTYRWYVAGVVPVQLFDKNLEVNEMKTVNFVVILWQDPIEYNARYAVLVAGGGINDNYACFWNDIGDSQHGLYSKLKNDYGYDPKNILVLDWDNATSPRNGIPIFGPFTEYYLIKAFDYLRTRMTINDFLFFTIDSHGAHNAAFGQGTIRALNHARTGELGIWYSDIDEMISGAEMVNDAKDPTKYSPHQTHTLTDPNVLQPGQTSIPEKKPLLFARMTILIIACNAQDSLMYLDGSNRIVMASSQHGRDTYRRVLAWGNPEEYVACLYYGGDTSDHPGFTTKLGSISASISFKSAFDYACDAATHNEWGLSGTPWYSDKRYDPQLSDTLNIAPYTYL